MYPADPGSNPVVSMLQRALRLSVSAGRQTQLIMNRSWSRTLIVALLHWLDYKTLQLLLFLLSILCLSNSEYWSQRRSQSGSIHSTNKMSMLQA